MKQLKEALVYLFPFNFFVLAACYRSPAFAYAACLALALGYGKQLWEKKEEKGKVKTDDALRHKVEQLEAALSGVVTREKARGW